MKQLKKSFRMPSVQTMISRKSSITNAFVNSIIPVVQPQSGEIARALEILGMTVTDVRCAYCGNVASEWDHLRPLVVKRRPTGFISEIGNLVPSCGKCNQSKGNKNWRTWITSNAPLSPTARGVPGLEDKIRRLAEYEKWQQRDPLDFGAMVGEKVWAEYWETCEEVIGALAKTQRLAAQLREVIRKSHLDLQGKTSQAESLRRQRELASESRSEDSSAS